MTSELTWLPEKTRAQISSAVDAVKRAGGERLVAVLLIGAAVHRDRPDRARHPELLLVVSELPVSAMSPLAEAIHPSIKKGLRFRSVTTEELRGSLDVYALEIAQWKAHHVVLTGDDPLAALSPTPEHLRHEIERSLRGIDRRVRNRLLQGMAAKVKDLDPALNEALGRLIVAAHHTLELAGLEPAQTEKAVLKAFIEWLELGSGPVLATHARLRSGTKSADPLAELASLSKILSAACRKIDGLKVGGDS